ncbi:MAG: hypothetical protein B0A82_22180 [Alkalinema sp. CACIAM 70d]|nr:MAG: hypothetical protein B0A82_22180 [Alkalinema sp. CACIAM 70d]
MAGLFGFGKKNEQEPQSKESFFLDGDVASSMGNIDYMRQSKKIRRTFPKSAGGQEFEIIKDVSASEALFNSQNGGFSASSAASKANENGASSNQAAQERRKLDTSMDMFRKMAKDMRR